MQTYHFLFIYFSLYASVCRSTATLTVPDTAERRHKDDAASAASAWWLAVFLALALTTALLILTILRLRCYGLN